MRFSLIIRLLEISKCIYIVEFKRANRNVQTLILFLFVEPEPDRSVGVAE